TAAGRLRGNIESPTSLVLPAKASRLPPLLRRGLKFAAPSIREMLEPAPRRHPTPAIAIERHDIVAGDDVTDARHCRATGFGNRREVPAALLRNVAALIVVVAVLVRQDVPLSKLECRRQHRRRR